MPLTALPALFVLGLGSVLLTPTISSLAAEKPVTASAPAPAKPAKKSEWVFSLLPKSLQKNPRLEITVITEMTPQGKSLPPVSPQRPAYFEMFTNGPRHLGHAQGNDAVLPQAEIEKLLRQALASNGHLPAQPPGKPPTLVILYTWGTHAVLRETDADNPALSGQQLAANILDRAALVGGEKFARELLKLFEQAEAETLAANAPTPPGGEAVFTPAMLAFANPVERFKRLSEKNEFLVDQAADDVYYVVATAYDYAAMAANKKVALWRTRMTVGAAGVAQEQAVPALVRSAAPYFGKEMSEAEILTRRAIREGEVEVGTPTVVEPKK